MKRARAFVQHSIRPSSGDSEGTPVGVVEAGASGLPVVATRHGGIKDVVVEEETRLLVDEGDVDAMALHMTRLAADPSLAGHLGAAGRDRIAARYGMDARIELLWGILQDAAGTTP